MNQEDRLHLLLIEDDHSVRDAIQLVLEQAGYRVSAIDRVDVAEWLIGNAPVDAVIADATLPHGSGIDVAHVARSFDVPAMVITGHSDLAAKLTRDGEHVMRKPIAGPELLGRVSALIASNRHPEHARR